MLCMHVSVLGPLTLDGGKQSVPPRDRAVLAALCVRPGFAWSTDAIAEAMWRDEPPPTMAKIIQGSVSRLRQTLGVASIETVGSGYRVTCEGVELDTLAFEKATSVAREHRTKGRSDLAIEGLAAALATWRGSPFEDIEPWEPAAQEAARLQEMRLLAEDDLLELRLDSGDHAGVAVDGVLLPAAEPWRERRWTLLALAQYRSGRQADALGTLRRAGRALREGLGVDPGPEIKELERRILHQDPALLDTPDEARLADDACPYRGLLAYETDDAEVFFGRSRLSDELVTRLAESPLLVLAGASGAGKSSVLRAGLVPRLRAQGREVIVVLPAADPYGSTAAALAASEGDSVVVIDQFEEVFTRNADVDAWLRWVVERVVHVAPVIVAVRADHIGHLGGDPRLARLVERGLHLVRPLEGADLREAIEGPAARAGLRLAPGLVDLIVRDVEDEAGGQPLMSHALVETWRGRSGRTLTVEGYQASGGIRGAVTRTAERVYASLGDDDREVVREIFVRLCPTGEDGRPERARVLLDVFAGDPRAERLIETLVRARLLTVDDGQVEIAHEALARSWPRLRRWLAEDSAGHRIRRHLTDSSSAWSSLGRPDDELYRGGRLELALDWWGTSKPRLSKVENEFLAASERQAETERVDLETRNRRLRGLLAGVGALLVLSLAAGTMAVVKGRQAASSEHDAVHATMVSRSAATKSTNKALSALLAVESYRRRPDAAAYSALLGTFTGSQGFEGYLHLRGVDKLNGALRPDGKTAVVDDSRGVLSVLDLASGKLTKVHDPQDPMVVDYSVLRVSADGRYVVQVLELSRNDTTCLGYPTAYEKSDGARCNQVFVFDLQTRRTVLGPLKAPFKIGDAALSPDAKHVAFAGGANGDVALYRVADGKLQGVVRSAPRPSTVWNQRDTGAVAFDGEELLAGSLAGPIKRLRVPSLEVIDEIDVPAMASHNALVVGPDHSIVSEGDDMLLALDAEGTIRWRQPLPEEGDECANFAVSAPAGRIFCGNYSGQLTSFELATGTPTGEVLDPQIGGVGDLAVSPDGNELMAFAEEKPIVSRWRLDGGGPVTSLESPGYEAVDYPDTQGNFPAAHDNGDGSWSFGMWDVARGQVSRSLPGGTAKVGQDLMIVYDDSDGSVAAVEGASNQARAIAAVEGALRVLPGPSKGQAVVISGWDENSGEQRPITATIYDSRTFRALDRFAGGPAMGAFAGSYSPDRSKLYVSGQSFEDEKSYLYELSLAGADKGKWHKVLDDADKVLAAAHGRLIIAGAQGDLTIRDVEKPETIVTTVPGARGYFGLLQASADGEMFMGSARDGTIQLYDTSTGIRLGDLIQSVVKSDGPGAGFLGADGKTLLVNAEQGVVRWDLTPEALLGGACQVAGRDLTEEEWSTYVGDEPYVRTCEQSWPRG